VDYLVDAVFNYPTLAEAYKVAALDAMNKMRQIARFTVLARGDDPPEPPAALRAPAAVPAVVSRGRRG
jgi:hypothetical protein